MRKGMIGLMLLLVSFVSFASADGDNHGMGGMMMGGYGSGMMVFGWFIWILVVIVLILLIAWLVKQLQKK